MYTEPGEQENRQAISIYYFLLRDYDALSPGPGRVAEVRHSFPLPTDRLKTSARQHRDIYATYLRWAGIKENQRENGMVTPAETVAIDVHYRFLSSYVHPISDRFHDAYGRNRETAGYDHYSSELALLYVITFAVREARSFLAMCALAPVATSKTERKWKRRWSGFGI